MQSNTTTIVLLTAAVALLGVAGMFYLQGQSQEAVGTVQQIQLETTNHGSFDAYVAGPNDAKAGVLIVHDWFGVSEMTKDTVSRLGELGYRTVAVDLYNGQSATNHADAFAYMNALEVEAVDAKLQVGLDFLKAPQRKLATFGFSMGGIHSLRANLADPSSVSATVIFYGQTVNDASELSVIESPVLFVTGSNDNPETGFEFSRAMGEAGQMAEIYIYPGAAHAYAQPLFNNGQNFDETATRVSWMLAEDFLARHLD